VILTARLVLPISGPPLSDGGLLIDDGTIRAVGPASSLIRDFPDHPCESLGNVTLLPGLVNAHTHLELTGLAGQLPLGRPFSEWVVSLLALRPGLDGSFYGASARDGAGKLLREGVTCVADVTTSGAGLNALRATGLRGVVFQEVLGLDPQQADHRLAMCEEAVRSLVAESRGSLVSVGISPHAPYSLSEQLLELCAAFLRRTGLLATTHVAESPEEVTYIGLGIGSLASELLPAVGRHAPSHRVCGESPVAFLDRFGLLSERLLAAHAVQVARSDLDLLRARNVAVAVCPRSNHHLRVGYPPLPRYLASGLRVGLGTDSLASNDSLSLWDELRFARTLYGETVTPRQLVTMATLGGATALGLGAQIGSLEPGKRADVIAVALDRFDESDPYETLLAQASEKAVVLTMVDGTARHRAS
jgi:cytosine/adenosine deaminase-related metal-dependent hydrolase